MKKRIKVYVAGSYSADNVLAVLQNIGRGEKACAELFRLGFAPFCPWHDKSYVIDNPDVEFKIEDFYEYSISWLEVSEIMLVLEGSENSGGVKIETELAKELGIPIFYSIEALVSYRGRHKRTEQKTSANDRYSELSCDRLRYALIRGVGFFDK